MTYLWLQTIGGRPGDEIDPAAIPADRLRDARAAIERAIGAGPDGTPIPRRSGVRLSATAERRRLILTLSAASGGPVATVAVAPRDRDGAKLWPMMVAAAQAQGLTVDLRRPREPWALVLPYSAGVNALARDANVAWLPALEAELACAWLEMCDDAA